MCFSYMVRLYKVLRSDLHRAPRQRPSLLVDQDVYIKLICKGKRGIICQLVDNGEKIECFRRRFRNARYKSRYAKSTIGYVFGASSSRGDMKGGGSDDVAFVVGVLEGLRLKRPGQQQRAGNGGGDGAKTWSVMAEAGPH